MPRFADPRREERYQHVLSVSGDERWAYTMAAGASFPGSPGQLFGSGGTERPLHEMVAVGDPLAGVDPRQRDLVLAKLRANGVGDMSGKRYFPGLARYVGDPEAMIGSRSEMKAILQSRGWGAQGLVNTRCRDRSIAATHEEGPYTVADDIVEKEIVEFARRNPQAAMDIGQNREFVFTEMREYLSGRGSCPLPGYKEEVQCQKSTMTAME